MSSIQQILMPRFVYERMFVLLLLIFFGLLPAKSSAEQIVSRHDLDCSAQFPCPEALQRRVDFWVEVFSRWEKDTAIFHDYDAPWRVYKTINGVKSCNEKQVKREKSRLTANLSALEKRLASGRKAKGRVQKQLAAQFDVLSTRQVKKAQKNIRCQLGVKNQFTEALARFERYKGVTARIIAEADMPADLLYLPFVESSYRANAYSKVGAAGMWQIMPSTARNLGMELSAVLDERLDPEAATRGAMRYFKDSQAKLIPLAKSLKPSIKNAEINPFIVTSYNYGINGMRRAIKQIGPDFMQVLNEYKSAAFQVAVKNFYASFLAARHLARNKDDYFAPIRAEKGDRYQTFILPTATSVARIKHQFSLSDADLKPLNPALTRFAWNNWRLIPAGYRLHLPHRTHRWLEQIDALNVLRPEAQPINKQVYRVRRGDTACGIANAFQVPCKALISENRLGRKAVVRIGQKLDIPFKGGKQVITRNQAKQTKKRISQYKVKRGDTACGVAKRFDVSCRELIRLNKLGKKANIKIAQQLRIPGGAWQSIPKAKPAVLKYKVKSGDTACAIAQRYALPCSKLLADNKLGKKGRIRVGQVLRLAGRSSKASKNLSISRYTVRSGDTACEIAERFDVACRELINSNRLGRKGRIKIGQVLSITSTIGSEAAPIVSRQSAADNEQSRAWLARIDALPDLRLKSISSGVKTTALANETLAHYADWMGIIGTQKIRAFNSATLGTDLKLGQNINLPITSAKTNKRFRLKRNEFHQVLAEQFKERFRISGVKTIKIKSGQSWWSIANQHELPMWLLIRFNPSAQYVLMIGKTLEVPIIAAK